VNRAVGGQLTGSPNRVTLTNPAGLYMQMPNFGAFKLPASYTGSKTAADFWHITRGQLNLPGMPPGNNYILHAYFEVDSDLDFVVGDILITSPIFQTTSIIQYGAQIAETLQIGIFATPVSVSAAPAPQPCVVFLGDSPDSMAFPQQLMPTVLWNAYYNTTVPNPQTKPLSLASNTSMAPVDVHAGQSRVHVTLLCSSAGGADGRTLPTVSFSSSGEMTNMDDISVRVLRMTSVEVAVPGNSYPSTCQALDLELYISAKVQQFGLRDIWVTNPGQEPGSPARGLLNVLPALPTKSA